jgi:hypothetical protein
MKNCAIVILALLSGMMAARPAGAQGIFKVETGEAFNKVMPRDFVLEGNSIPTEKRNSVLVLTPSGARVIAGLLDTSGYSSQVQGKYLGMLIVEGKLNVCGNPVAIGSYGFGLAKPHGGGEGQGSRFVLYNQAGARVAECPAESDAKIKTPRPLQVVTNGRTARLYLGRTWVELK